MGMNHHHPGGLLCCALLSSHVQVEQRHPLVFVWSRVLFFVCRKLAAGGVPFTGKSLAVLTKLTFLKVGQRFCAYHVPMTL
jgi:hypothetical protein